MENKGSVNVFMLIFCHTGSKRVYNQVAGSVDDSLLLGLNTCSIYFQEEKYLVT